MVCISETNKLRQNMLAEETIFEKLKFWYGYRYLLYNQKDMKILRFHFFNTSFFRENAFGKLAEEKSLSNSCTVTFNLLTS